MDTSPPRDKTYLTMCPFILFQKISLAIAAKGKKLEHSIEKKSKQKPEATGRLYRGKLAQDGVV